MTTVLITGVSRGIGKALAQQALQRGWSVIGSVRGAKSADMLRSELGPQFQALVFDVTDPKAINQATAGVSQPIDILINNAGIIGPERQSTLDMDFEGFAKTLAVNTIAPLMVTQAFLPHLKRSTRGRVLVVSSRMGSLSYAKSDQIAYRASKAAVNKVCQGLATDLKPMGIAVAPIHPGWVRTDMGGQNADIDVHESAKGIIAIAERLDIAGTGRFLSYDGATLSW